MDFKIAVLAGDGIGPEIEREAKKVLDKVCEKYGHSFSYSEVLLGGASIDVHGVPLTDEAIASMQNGEFDRCVVAITGNAFVCGDVIYDLSMRYAAGEKLDHEVYRDLIPVTPENLEEMITK